VMTMVMAPSRPAKKKTEAEPKGEGKAAEAVKKPETPKAG